MMSVTYIITALLSVHGVYSYVSGDKKLNWDKAQKFCESFGSNLASITSSNQQRQAKRECFTKASEVMEGCWTGLKDRKKEDRFFYIDGTPFSPRSYTNWYPGEPNNVGNAANGEDCVEISYGFNGKWNDYECSGKLYPLCNDPERVLIKPGKELKNDPNIRAKTGKGNNKKVKRDGRARFVLYGEPPTNDGFPLTVILAKDEYGFKKSAVAPGELAFTVRGLCRSIDYCGLYTVIGVGDSQYISISTKSGGRGKPLEVDIYPACNGNIASGDAKTLADGVTGTLGDALAGGDSANWFNLGSIQSSTSTGQYAFPFTVELVNDIKKNEMTLRYASRLFPSGLTCTFSGSFAANTGININLSPYFETMPNGKTDIIGIPSIALYGNLHRSASLGTVEQIFATDLLIGDGENNDDDVDDDEDDEGYWDDYTEDEEFVFMQHTKVEMKDNFQLEQGLLASVAVLVFIGIAIYKYWPKNKKTMDMSENRPLLQV